MLCLMRVVAVDGHSDHQHRGTDAAPSSIVKTVSCLLDPPYVDTAGLFVVFDAGRCT